MSSTALAVPFLYKKLERLLSNCFTVEPSPGEENATPPFATHPPFALKTKLSGRAKGVLAAGSARKEGGKWPPAPPSTKMVQFPKSGFACECTGKDAQGSRVGEAWQFSP